MLVEVKSLSKRFDKLHALKAIHFTMKSGEVLGFIGPNGAGKTTAMRILSTLETASGGDAFVGGYSVTHQPEKVRPLLGLMPDYHGVYNNTDVMDYLDFFARAYRLRGAKRRAAIDGVMEFADLHSLAHKPVTALSKGMRQRLSLAQMLINDPPVLIMDEPTAGLDPRARIDFRELVKALSANGKTVLISSHILSDLADMCDRVAIIEQGAILATGSLEEVQAMARNRRVAAQGDPGAQTDAIHRQVEITVIQEPERLEKFLHLQPGLADIRCDDSRVEALFAGDDKALSQLLQRIMAERFEVVHFTCRRENLEDVFMTLTDGRVQ